LHKIAKIDEFEILQIPAIMAILAINDWFGIDRPSAMNQS